MSVARAACLCSLVAVLFASAAHAKVYVDTKQRFSLEVPAGWSLAPMPGDTQGMIFKKSVDGVPGLFRVSVRATKPGETLKETLEAMEKPFHDEIGFRSGSEVPSSLGSFPATRRTFSVYASGDASTVRAIELYAAHIFGHVHVVHFETLEKKRSAFSRDVDRMLASYEALASRDDTGPLIGRWDSSDDTADLALGEDGRFSLGPLSGTFRVVDGRLALRVPSGEEQYRVILEGNTLTLHSPNLDKPKSFTRKGAARFAARKEEVSAKPLTREQLLGRWRVVGDAATETLVLNLSPSGSVSFGQLSGRWRFQDGRLTIVSTAGVTLTYSASFARGRLQLGGGDLDHEVELVLDEKR